MYTYQLILFEVTCNVKKGGKVFQMFVAISEYMSFIYKVSKYFERGKYVSMSTYLTKRQRILKYQLFKKIGQVFRKKNDKKFHFLKIIDL